MRHQRQYRGVATCNVCLSQRVSLFYRHDGSHEKNFTMKAGGNFKVHGRVAGAATPLFTGTAYNFKTPVVSVRKSIHFKRRVAGGSAPKGRRFECSRRFFLSISSTN